MHMPKFNGANATCQIGTRQSSMQSTVGYKPFNGIKLAKLSSGLWEIQYCWQLGIWQWQLGIR